MIKNQGYKSQDFRTFMSEITNLHNLFKIKSRKVRILIELIFYRRVYWF